ncbi:NepR family anti-sigma factor [Tropicimonas sp. IMCC34043]|uniref:NepR family anti-sigma factor n=1 Tax=Tropicimonas sp. IMCC34043 TaxID=2248760 RepID=UPI000E22EABC|nr:NepR family anti-sigma factor [Tropicimonas sp. IMCC34043]
MPLRKKALRTQIDENLRLIFEEDARAELPDRLLSLLDRLDAVELPPVAPITDAEPNDDTGGSSS